ncbi:MAG: hypothetical protein IKJ11_09650 [Clostridia bacterium]|nr:hypothetical protein [Clostridia bacterium]
MKRRTLCALVLLTVLAAAFFALSRAGAPAQRDPIEPVSDRDFMRAELTYDETLRTLRGTQMLTARNRTGQDLDEIVLRLYMNGMPGCSAYVSGAAFDGKAAAFSQDAEDPTVLRIACQWPDGEEIRLSWTVMIKHAKTDGAAAITLPSKAMFEGGAWRTDAYDDLADLSGAEAFDAMITLDGEIAAQMRMARDASFALLPGGSAKEKEIGGVRVCALARDSGTAAMLLAGAQDALESLMDAGFPYPFDSLTVAQGGTGREDGLALSGLIMLDADGRGEQLRRKLTRLIARQIFGVQVGSDPWNAPWLSHTLASCAEMLAYKRLRGTAAYEERLYGELELATRITRPAGVCVGASTAHFGSDSEMMQVLRDQGAAMLLGVEQAVGDDAFVRALQAYVRACAGGRGSAEALCRALEQETGSSWDGYISDMLAF